MKAKNNFIPALVFIIVILFLYSPWFTHGEIIGGDWPYFFKETLKEIPLSIPSWNTWQGNGLGGINPTYFLQIYLNFTVFFVNFLNIPWIVVYKIFWFGLFIFLSIFSSIYLANTLFKNLSIWQKSLTSLIFVSNTYILLVVAGGQMGVALAFSFSPFLLARFIKHIDFVNSQNFKFNLKTAIFKSAVITGLVLAIGVMFDPRISYIAVLASLIYALLNFKKILSRHSLLASLINLCVFVFFVFVVPGFIAILLHASWLLPFLITGESVYSDPSRLYTHPGIVEFLSFATFSQTLSILHANWPENIFGKVSFMRPEFLIIPIIAYSSLLFANNKFRKIAVFLSVLGIIGAFLSKGTNEPFGKTYLWMFENIPGFVMFRDATKFYLLTVISYSVLIPFVLMAISNKLSGLGYSIFKKKEKITYIVLVLFLVFWTFTIRETVLGKLGGTFKRHDVPGDYIILKDFMYKQPEFFRTLWIPRQQRFTYYSNIHPSVEGVPLFNATGSAEAIKNLKEERAQEYLSDLSIKYVIVPYDSMGEIFQEDRKYDKKQYEDTINSLREVNWLKEIEGFGKIKIFEVPSPKDHLQLSDNGSISYEMISPVKYAVSVFIQIPQELVFSEKYNPYWVAKVNGEIMLSEKTAEGLNSFKLEKGDYDLEIIFLQDKYNTYGKIISAGTLAVIILLFLKQLRIFLSKQLNFVIMKRRN